ncbi:multiheme c-type cytochrome [Aurantivibrio plasticivorans]
MKIIKKGFVFVLLVVSSGSFSESAIENRSQLTQSKTQPTADSLFFPHRASTTHNNLASTNSFESAEICRGCHQEIYNEWRSSMMANSWEDPIYRALLKKASEETDGAIDYFCTGCHSPAGLLTGKINSQVNRTLPEEDSIHLPGVDCDACHRMTGISGLTNGAYILDANADVNVKRGPRRDAESPYHQTEYSTLHKQSEMCGACHNVSHPFNDIPIERTYDEWYESAYRTQGIECQDCHMPRVKGRAAIMGPMREDRASHHFSSANTTIIERFGDHQSVETARKFLQTSATIEFVDLPRQLSAGGVHNIQVKVTNVGAGHKLPTGFPEGREVWIDFQVLNQNNEEMYRLGQVSNGKTEPGTKNFKVHLGNTHGEEVDIEVWTVDRILSDNRILPNGYATETYRVPVPDNLNGLLTVNATLYYWPFSQAFADHLLGKDKINVSIEQLATTSQTIQIH